MKIKPTLKWTREASSQPATKPAKLKKLRKTLVLAGAISVAACTTNPRITLSGSGSGVSSSASVGSKPSNQALQFVKHAQQHIGVPYLLGGVKPEEGFDCSGLVLYAANKVGLNNVPRTSSEQAQIGMSVSRNNLAPGDLLFFNTQGSGISHVAIYKGKGEFIHSPTSGAKVRVESLNVKYWSSRFVKATRIFTGNQGNALVASAKP